MSIHMPVPRSPEGLNSLKKRYNRALEFTYDSAACVINHAICPGEVAANVFDFADGLRLIISRQRVTVVPYGSGDLVIHVSASFPEECEIAEYFSKQQANGLCVHKCYKQWIKSIPGRFVELSGDHRPLEYLGRSKGFVPNFVLHEE